MSKVQEVNEPRAERETPPLQAAIGKAVGKDTQTGIMILALATRHRVERPAISMEGGTVISYGAALPAAVCFAFDNIVIENNPHSTKCGFCRLMRLTVRRISGIRMDKFRLQGSQ